MKERIFDKDKISKRIYIYIYIYRLLSIRTTVTYTIYVYIYAPLQSNTSSFGSPEYLLCRQLMLVQQFHSTEFIVHST